MATAAKLVEQGLLMAIEVELDPDEQPQRLIYAHPRAVDWLNNDLPQLESDNYVDGALRPQEQADAILYSFIVGKSIFGMPPKCMRPQEHGVWELRTHDLRFFGWFWRPTVFILTSVDAAKRCKDINLYAGYRDEARYIRDKLDLDPPKFILGELRDVL